MLRNATKKVMKQNQESTNLTDNEHKKNGLKTDISEKRKKLLKMSEAQSEMDLDVATHVIGAVIYPEESPFYILTVAGNGEDVVLEKLLLNKKALIETKDAKGRYAVHHAARCGQVKCLKLLLDYGSDLNASDNDGDTPLHLAVETEQLNVIRFLLDNNCEPAVLNHALSAPIHLAVKRNNMEALKALLYHPTADVDPNALGMYEATPLHYAAFDDRSECAKILLENGAKLCMPCRIGLYPMHIAAQNSSTATLDILIEFAGKLGCGSRSELLTRMNQEKNTPLHAAVMGGSLKVVKLCLQGGSKIDALQENGNSAVHLGAGQGELEILKMMEEHQPSEFKQCIAIRNNRGHTPLHDAITLDKHFAAMFLIEKGSDINAMTNDGYSAVLHAARKRSWKCLQVLLEKGANALVKDPEDRNIVHLIILGGGHPTSFKLCFCNEKFTNLLNEADRYGCTALHYASKQGLLKTTNQLLDLGASISLKTIKQQSALHFAAKYGRLNTCRSLLNNMTNAINETDGSGQTALHLAANAGHEKVVRLLLSNGAGIFKDVAGNTALHLAAEHGYTHTIECILTVYPNFINSTNKIMNSCLHIAAMANHPKVVTLLLSMGAEVNLNSENFHVLDLALKCGSKDVCMAIITHDRWMEIMDLKSVFYGCSMIGMIKVMPEICQIVMDRCRVPSSNDQNEEDFHYIHNFKYLEVNLDINKSLKKDGSSIVPLFALNYMVKFGRVDCLSHPLCNEFLSMKWKAYGLGFHLINLIIYIVYLVCLTTFISVYDFPPNNMTMHEDYGKANITEIYVHEFKMELTNWQYILACFILIFCCGNIFKEFAQMFHQKWSYFGDKNNYLEWVLYLSTFIFIIPFLHGYSTNFQWQCAAICIFLAWFNILLFLQRFDRFGIYVVMFLEILQTLILVGCIFSVLIFGFSLSFYILQATGTSLSFTNLKISFFSTTVMMLGNIDYLDIWVEPYSDNNLPNVFLNFLFLTMFIILMPILLINLMIGLAVGDIEAVQKNAKLKRIAMQVQLHTELEQKLPHCFLKLVNKPLVKVYPNRRCGIFGLIVNKIRSNTEEPFEMDSNTLEHQSYLYRELHQQKLRTKNISSELNKHYDLLRLIIQKMEIHSEADDFDEDIQCSELSNFLNNSSEVAKPEGQQSNSLGWSSPSLRHAMLKQSYVLSKWSSTKK